ncbi:MAG TPA: phosphatase PAP2 family protein [Terriglobales bacterium]|nr:phosphatase PAP2 family protein [Terriglobales bacterium]
MSTPLAAPRAHLAVALAAFVAVAAAALLLGTDGVDTTVRLRLLDAASADVMTVMRIVNVAGNWKFLLPATLLLLVVFDRARRTWWVWVALMVAAPLAEGLLKVAIGRARPESPAYGFPSGHATAAAAYFGAVLYLARELRPPRRALVRAAAIAVMVLVGIARVMLRAHWPSDVVAGLALGLCLASAATVLAARVDARTAGRPAWRERARQLEREVYALYFAVRDPRVPWPAKALAACVVAYALSPIDLIPDVIPVLGYVDDLVLIPLGVLAVRRLVPAGVLTECRVKAAELAAKPRSGAGAVAIVAIWLIAAAATGYWLYARLGP